jgi:hypothetical protein
LFCWIIGGMGALVITWVSLFGQLILNNLISKHKRILVLSDLHLPYHRDPDAFNFLKGNKKNT